jgi:hypothetical protein
VADDPVLGEATVETPSGLGEGLLYLLWGHVVSPLSSPSLGERKRNSLTLLNKFPRRPLLERLSGNSYARTNRLTISRVIAA